MEQIHVQPQISAHISEGVKLKEALQEEAFLPPRLVLTHDGFQQVAHLIEDPPPPTAAMMKLMNGS